MGSLCIKVRSYSFLFSKKLLLPFKELNFVEMTVSCISYIKYNEVLYSIIMHLVLNGNVLLTSTIYKQSLATYIRT